MAESLQLALKSALVSGDVMSAIKEYEDSLTSHDKEALQAISQTDLQTLVKLEDMARSKKGMPKIGGGSVALRGPDWIGGIW